MTETKFQEY